ncbi:hypothetical protein [Petroclostridium sp. X23]|uniref:hypothetical protein n=1 Tax=Petroclostridium sp. X23 TaxID=3045146 RepID=UPI0024AD7C4B|nr:hypothetical protein [Petroclostridium sp. X23]WHH59267.1 hypothetical protein QKW49_00415 [Petroclostridium sp. X23]
MGISLIMILASAGGGILGACLGGLPAITLWGAVLLIASLAGIATGNAAMVWDFGFNPLFGAQVVFIGGAAAAAYAWSKGKLETGLDILKPLSGFQKVDILLVGGIFGIIGMIIERVGTSLAIPTDNVALSVVVAGWLSRLIFDRNWLKNRREKLAENNSGWFPKGDELATLIVMGAGIGFAGGLASYKIGSPLIPFGIALLFILYLQMGFKGLTWHHIVLIGGIVGLQEQGSMYGLIWAAIMGVVVAIVCKCIENLTIPETNSYIDPPVTSIAIGTSLVILLTSIGVL